MNKLNLSSHFNLCTSTSVCKFSKLSSIHFLLCCHRELVKQSRASLLDHFLYYHGLNVWFRGDALGRNKMLVTRRVSELKGPPLFFLLAYLFSLFSKQDFKKDDFEYLVEDWETKIDRCDRGDQKWGLFHAKKSS